MIITRTPLRISLVGGGTDLPAFYKKSPGAVFSFAVNKYVYVIVNPKFDGRYRVSYSQLEIVDEIKDIQHDIIRSAMQISGVKHGLEVTTVADIPGGGTGLGSSSALAVGILKALTPYLDCGTLAEKAFFLESEGCGSPVGKQDQYASAYGGMNFITFGKNNVNVRPIIPSADWMHDFESCTLLLWTGITRNANDILKEQRKNFDDGASIAHGRKLARLAHDFLDEVAGKGRVRQLGEIMHESWALKRQLSSGISNSEIDTIYDNAMRAGAYGGKLLGAGGGGFFFFFAPNYHHKAIIEATGLKKVEFKVEEKGSEVVYG